MTNKGKQLNNMLYKVNETHKQCIHELEQYGYYIARCLKEQFNIHEAVNIIDTSLEGTAVCQAIAYPIDSMTKETPNPLFFLGYIFTIKEDGIHIAFAENYKKYEDLKQEI